MLANFANLITSWDLESIHLLSADYPHIFSAYQKREQREVIVKIGVEARYVKNEARALQHYNGHSCVKIFAVDLAQFALLLEFVKPGKSMFDLFPFHDQDAVQACAKILKQLHAVPLQATENFMHLRDWLSIFEKDFCKALPRNDLERARGLAHELLDSSRATVLLHGDLHHQNILTCARQSYVAIDPKGVLGDPAFDVAAFVRNPFQNLLSIDNPKLLIDARLDLFSQLLGFDLERLRAWTYVGAILACAWNLEDGLPYDSFLATAQLLGVS